MKLKLNKNILRVSLWSLATAALLVSLGFASKEQEAMKCKGLRIRIADETGQYFIEPGDIMDLLNSTSKQVKGKTMHDINISMLEKIVYSNPFVEKAEVYSTIDGFVNIDAWQRNPLVRIINKDNEHFYIDDRGIFMPVSQKYTSQVVVASGFIFDNYAQGSLKYAVRLPADSTSSPILVQINEIAQYLKDHDFWNSQIEQIYVNENSEIELIPRIGNHSILIGTSANLDDKLNRLYVFYTKGLTNVGWDKYSMINLKYQNQVVCTKSGTGSSN